MISLDQAFDIVMGSVRRLGTEKVPLAEALGRILAADAISDADIPPADVSVMDGFACRRKDLDIDAPVLTEVETIPAGHLPARPVGPGQCSRIMTGAVIPQGADAVVMVEDTRRDGNHVRILNKSNRSYIRRQGEDLKKGDLVLRGGVRIGPAQMAVLASAGLDPAPVSVVPTVGVLATGDELVEPSEAPGPGRIRNSNGPQLCAQIAQAGCNPKYFGIVRDAPDAMEQTLRQVMVECDVVIFSGGVSVGQFDFVPDVLRQNGVDVKFQRVCVKPGRPTVFGLSADRYVFGLPGNPVSTFVIFEILVRPFLMALMGHYYKPVRVRARLTEAVQRKDTDRREFVPVVLAPDGGVSTLDYHGSAHIHALCSANGLLDIPASCEAIPCGAEVDIRLI